MKSVLLFAGLLLVGCQGVAIKHSIECDWIAKSLIGGTDAGTMTVEAWDDEDACIRVQDFLREDSDLRMTVCLAR